MEALRGKFERNTSLNLYNNTNNEESKPQFKKTHSLESDTHKKEDSENQEEKIPEIKDIYDYIYGNVQSKLEFYENKRNETNTEESPKPRSSVDEDNNETTINNQRSFSEASDSTNELLCEAETSDLINETLTHDKSPEKEQEKPDEEKVDFSTANSITEARDLHENPDLLKECGNSCIKCRKADFINDRTEVLTEINTNIKLELESFKQELKKEIAKNNELNFEIANIESALETYYKEAKNQKSALASIYATVKNFTSKDKGEAQESYTYKRIRTISDYMETLKHKLEHQDRIIKNNFVENPYYTDVIIKHKATLKQLDEISHENQDLKEEIKRKTVEELEIIKELNRQKFQVENKCKEIESYYKNEVASKGALIEDAEQERKKQYEDFQALLNTKDQEMLKIQKNSEARIHNYKQELLIFYRKWNQQRKGVNNTNLEIKDN